MPGRFINLGLRLWHDSLEKVSVALAISSSAESITGSAQFNGSS